MRHISALDGLRGIAVMVVFLFHAVHLLPVSTRATVYVSKLLMQGWIGVDLFFVLSGFLITGILLNTRESIGYYRNFYARRALRIFPLYFSVLIAVLILAAAINSPQLNQFLPTSGERKWYFLYLTNYIAVFKGEPGWDFLWHFWTLAVEEQFYLVWPVCIFMLGARGTRWFAAAGAPACLLVRLALCHRYGPIDGLAFGPTRMEPLLIGALCAVLYRDHNAIENIRKLLPVIAFGAFGIFFLTVLTINDARGYAVFCRTFSYSLLGLCFGAVIMICACTDGEYTLLQKVLSNRALTQVGAYAYGIYVFHPLIIFPAGLFLFRPTNMATWLVYVGCTWVTTFLVAALSYELFERRFLSYKRSFRDPIPSAVFEQG
jgi:peptidoglycan/LPS O-acetylase OafA/YrhL